MPDLNKSGFSLFICNKILLEVTFLKICIFPGTFNPIHNAHIKVAEFALSHYGFDKVIFIPAYIPPHKNINKELAEHRFNMVRLAISENPKFEISDIEYLSENKSYTILTVKKIIEQYNIRGKLNFLIGTDAFTKIDSWYEKDELKELVHFIVFPRGVKIDTKEGFDYELAPMKFIDISSTELRNKSKNDTTLKVKEYIEKNELYIK